MDETPVSKSKPVQVGKDETLDRKKVEKVVTGEVTRRKKPLGKRFAETFVGGEDARGVANTVLFDVMIPAAKDMIADAITTGIERTLFGEVRSAARRGGSRRAASANGYVSYNRYSPSSILDRREEPRPLSRRARAMHDFDEVLIESRVEAEEVIDKLFDIISQYEVATVADLYDLLGTTSTPVDNKWGWTGLPGAGVTRTRGGYLLDLPRPTPID